MNDLRGFVLLILPAAAIPAREQIHLRESAWLVIDNLEHGAPAVVKDRIAMEGEISRYDTLGRVARHIVRLEEEAS